MNETFECDGKMDCADNSDELTEKCDPKFEDRLHGNCSAEEFQCQSGECISLDSLCDGSPECLDRSDEIVLFCSSNVCPPFGFRCGYGGCIDGRRQCDGVFDCADDSDENTMLCGKDPPSMEEFETTAPQPIAEKEDTSRWKAEKPGNVISISN